MFAVIIEVNSSFLTVAIRTRNVDCSLIRSYGLGRLMHHSAILVADNDIHIINSGVATDVDVVAVGGDFWYYVGMTIEHIIRMSTRQFDISFNGP